MCGSGGLCGGLLCRDARLLEARDLLVRLLQSLLCDSGGVRMLCQLRGVRLLEPMRSLLLSLHRHRARLLGCSGGLLCRDARLLEARDLRAQIELRLARLPQSLLCDSAGGDLLCQLPLLSLPNPDQLQHALLHILCGHCGSGGDLVLGCSPLLDRDARRTRLLQLEY